MIKTAVKGIKHIEFYIGLIAFSVIFLFIERLTHIEFMYHLAAIPLEILVGGFIAEKFLKKREVRDKRQQLMFIKSYMFRTAMRPLFIGNFAALESPSISMSRIRQATIEDLMKIREEAKLIKYRSTEDMELVIMEYVKAEHVWHSFMERAITYNFEEIFHDMIYILHFINDVKLFKEINPDKLFIHEAQSQEILMKKVWKVLGDGIQKFLDYAIELKKKQPTLFEDLISDFEQADADRKSFLKIIASGDNDNLKTRGPFSEKSFVNS